MAFYRETIGLMRAVGASYKDFRNYFFQSISHKILMDKLVKYGLDNWTVRWVSLGLTGWKTGLFTRLEESWRRTS